MARLIVLLVVVVATGFQANAYTSGIAITTEKTVSAQVFVNGKLCNKVPSHFIRIKSPSGSYHVKVKLYDAQNRSWQEFEQTVKVDKGFEHYFTIAQSKSNKPYLSQVKRYPVYSKYFLDYRLYTKNNTT